MINTLHVDSVLKGFKGKQILTDIYLTCQTGEIIGLLGRNGSGKSTLLKIIFGVLKAENQFVKINNQVVTRFAGRSNFIRYLPQQNFLPGHLSIKKAIELFCKKSGKALILNQDWIEPVLHQKVNQLSGGERRLLETVLIICSDAPFILLDEPFNGISPLRRDIIKDLIRSQSPNKGFLLTDHDYQNILALSTRIVLLSDGGTRAIKERKELVNRGYLPSSE